MILREIFDILQPRLAVETYENGKCEILYDTSNKIPCEILNGNYRPEEKILNMNVKEIRTDIYGRGILIIDVCS